MFDLREPTLASWLDAVIAVTVSLLLGLFVAFIYRRVMRGFSYSVSIMHTLVYLPMITSIVMLVVANEIARAFTLVGALSVIRFRTPIKDAKDTAFIFLSLAAGMGAGVGLYLVVTVGTVLIGLFILLLQSLKFGLRVKQEILVKFSVPLNGHEDSTHHRDVFERHLHNYKLINARSLHENQRLELTFLVTPHKQTDMIQFSRTLSATPNIERVSIIRYDDEDYSQNVF